MLTCLLYVRDSSRCTRMYTVWGKDKKEKNIDKSHTAAMLETLLIKYTQNKVIKHHFRYAILSFYIYNHSYKMFDRFWLVKVMLRHSFKVNNVYRHPREILHFKEYSYSQLPRWLQLVIQKALINAQCSG